jgi:hypothetical protein
MGLVVAGLGGSAIAVGIAAWQASSGPGVAPLALCAALGSATCVHTFIVNTDLVFLQAVDVGEAFQDTFVVDATGSLRGAVVVRHAVAGDVRLALAEVAVETNATMLV